MILAKTVKGYGTGAGEANTAHNTKKVVYRQPPSSSATIDIPVKDEELENLPFLKPEEGSAEARYLSERRAALGGFDARNAARGVSVSRRRHWKPSRPSSMAPVAPEISTTAAFVRILAQ